MQYKSLPTAPIGNSLKDMTSPQTPILQTSGSWETPATSPPPITGFPTPPPRNRVARKPVPQRLGLRAMFDYTPPQKVETKPTAPLNIGAKARDRLNVEREYVQCMVCRNSSFVSCTAELVCSHHVHPRCLQSAVTSNKNGDAYPSCEICKYPAKPKDQLLNQHIRTALLRMKQLETATPPPRSASRTIRKRTSSIYSEETSPASSLSTAATSISDISTAHDSFQTFENRVPIHVAVKPAVKALSLTAKDPCCQFLVTVTCPDYTYTQPPHNSTPQDERISSRMAVAFSHALDIPRSELGTLRFERRFEYSSDGSNWKTVRTLLFEHVLVLASTESGTPILHTDISTNLVSARLVSNPEASVCVALKLNSSPEPFYISSNNREHLFPFMAALSDKSLLFPLTRPNPTMSLQSPFVGDYIHRLPCHTVVCIPESINLSILAEAVGRLKVFDKIGVVHYGNKIATYSLNRQSWPRWSSLLNKEPVTPTFNKQSIAKVLSAANGLFKDDEKAACSIVLLSENTDSCQPSETPINVPVYTIGVGEEHNASVLTRISANTGGHYIHAPLANLGQFITNVVFNDETLTHTNVNVTIKPRQGNLSGICGYSSSPGESSSNVEENSSGHMVVNLGRLHAGSKRTFIVCIDIDEKILKYTCEDSELDIVEVIAEASMADGGSTVMERESGRISMELHDAPITFFRGLHAQMPITCNDRLEALPDRIVLAAAASLDRVVKLIQNQEYTQAIALVRKMVQNLEKAANHISMAFKCATKREADLVLNCSTLIDVLLSEFQFLQRNLTQKTTLANLLSMIWILRSGRSFSRNTSLEAIYFDANKLNVL